MGLVIGRRKDEGLQIGKDVMVKVLYVRPGYTELVIVTPPGTPIVRFGGPNDAVATSEQAWYLVDLPAEERRSRLPGPGRIRAANAS
ncbi:MAG: carbon storage regulator [Patescibacteria group bacterium]|nr:carbon storage regulator [Patescibacteria group bacterium]